ncbi:MAG: SRPBCC domain-containing protein, partial [Bacteroidota bacterium]|nr:SRPBCC domain-containing protein [Bacteroidota bacterium]
MSAPLIVQNSTTLNAPISKVWDALTNPQQTKKYMFGCETVSDWKKGSPLLWRMNYEGKELIAVKGSIVDIIPEKVLVYTTIDPNSTIADIPENYLT